MYGDNPDEFEKPAEADLIELFNKFLTSAQVSVISKQYALTALVKLSRRLQAGQDDIKSLIETFGSHLNIDLQQRGVEYTQLFGSYQNLRPALLEKMPPFQLTRPSPQNGNSFEENSSELIENGLEDIQTIPTGDSSNALLDLLCGIDMTPQDVTLQRRNSTNILSSETPTTNNQDLLGGLVFSASPSGDQMLTSGINLDNHITSIDIQQQPTILESKDYLIIQFLLKKKIISNTERENFSTTIEKKDLNMFKIL